MTMDTKLKNDLISTFKKIVEMGESAGFYMDCNFLSSQ